MENLVAKGTKQGFLDYLNKNSETSFKIANDRKCPLAYYFKSLETKEEPILVGKLFLIFDEVENNNRIKLKDWMIRFINWFDYNFENRKGTEIGVIGAEILYEFENNKSLKKEIFKKL